MYWLPADKLSFEVGLIGAICILFGLVCFVASAHWWASRITHWWAWLCPTFLFVGAGCLIIWKG